MSNNWKQKEQIRQILPKQKLAKALVKVFDDKEVLFPYATVYPSQIKIIEAVTTCIQDSANALIESPTGTGKTLSLMCAAAAALK